MYQRDWKLDSCLGTMHFDPEASIEGKRQEIKFLERNPVDWNWAVVGQSFSGGRCVTALEHIDFLGCLLLSPRSSDKLRTVFLNPTTFGLAVGFPAGHFRVNAWTATMTLRRKCGARCISIQLGSISCWIEQVCMFDCCRVGRAIQIECPIELVFTPEIWYQVFLLL